MLLLILRGTSRHSTRWGNKLRWTDPINHDIFSLSFIGILLVLVSSQQNNTIKDVVKLNYYNWLCNINQYSNPCICFCKRLNEKINWQSQDKDQIVHFKRLRAMH